MADPGLGLRFKVAIDGHELGNWQKCDGLNIEYDIQEYREGGQNGYVHRLPGRAKYENLKLTRPVDSSTTWSSSSRCPSAARCSSTGRPEDPAVASGTNSKRDS